MQAIIDTIATYQAALFTLPLLIVIIQRSNREAEMAERLLRAARGR